MRVQAFMFYGTAVFFLATDVVYWLWSNDWTGTSVLGLAVGLAGLIGFYIHFTVRRLERANADAAGEVGFFSPHSWWPLFVALSAAAVALGIVFGWWLVIFGVCCAILTTLGLVFEYYRGHFAH